MSFYIQTHIVKKGDSLDNIAEKYQIEDVEMLRYYHNQNCSLKMHIGKSVLPGQEILIPTQKEIEKIIFQRSNVQIEKQNREISSLENERLLPQFIRLNHSYNIRMTDFQKEDNKESQNTTEFEVQLKYISKDNEGNYIISSNKKNLFVNNETPQLKVYELALQCASCLNYLEFKIDPKGKITGIHNYRKILELWNKEKQKLQHLYEDPYSLRYIDHFDYTITHQEYLVKHLKRDLFLQFYFSSFYTKYDQAKAETESKFGMHGVLYQNTYEIKQDSMINIQHTAECIDPREQQEILAHIEINDEYQQTEDPYLLESKISGNYELDRENKILHKADIKIDSFFYGVEETTQIEISKVN